MRVYISGPLGGGDKWQNIDRAIQAMKKIILSGHDPFCPHLSPFAEFFMRGCRLPYMAWMRRDLAWLSQADVVVRIPGESPGADVEVARAGELGIPVVFGVKAFFDRYVNRNPIRPADEAGRSRLPAGTSSGKENP